MVDISQAEWSVNDSSNNAAAPNGAPEGMLPSGVNNTMRAMMGGTKRFWDRINPTILATNVGNAYTYTPTVVAPSLVNGEVYSFFVPAINTGAATLNVGVGGAKALVKQGTATTVPLDSSDFAVGAVVMAAWRSLSDHFVVINTPIQGLLASLSGVSSLDLRSTSAVIKLDIDSVSAAIKTDIGSVSAAVRSYLITADRSTSAVVKADISSVSAVLTAAINGVIPAGSAMFFYNNAAPTGWTFIAADDYTLITQNVVGNGGAGGGAWSISGLTVAADHAHSFAVNSDVESQGHQHVVAGSTGVSSANANMLGGDSSVATNVHGHAVSILSGFEDALHTHVVTATVSDAGAHSHTGDGTWRPKHLKVILCSKN